ncbi:hypothetical protein P378_06940 [Desulforamulus profundi]|uniref:Uncharacterized protein n=1 Tax=Desulforamulus profundi TaxID=1383067 RepID=A0A2C6L356_9FIRM|nr:hypothetical protein P378_06940 [Desulforamulus profundi]
MSVSFSDFRLRYCSISPTLLHSLPERLLFDIFVYPWLNNHKGRVVEESRFFTNKGPAAEAAAKSPAGRVFTNFARHPLATVKETGAGYLVSWTDLRYRYRGRHPFTAYTRLDKDLNILDSGLAQKY